MPRIVMLVVVGIGLGIGGYFAYQQFRTKLASEPAGNSGHPPTTPATGKLVLLVVFDQLRGDYLARWAEHFGPNGFERMKREGVWYRNTRIPYASTSTGPGHASLVTGVPPAVHGIVENDWWDRKASARVYCCQPSRPYDRVPPLAAGSAELSRGSGLGFSPENVLVDTVGDRLKASTQNRARVFSLSIKDRSAVLMGGKKPDGIYCFDNRDGIFHTGAYYQDRIHPWVATFNAERLVNRWFDQTWDRFRPELDYAKILGNPDEAAGESFGFNGQGRLFPHPYQGKLSEPSKGYFEAVECSPAGNDLLLALAKTAITAEKLGQSDTADLLCLSFSSNDLVGHAWGPDSWEVFDITLRTDQLVADLLAFLDTTLGLDRYIVVVTSDHGVCPIPEQKKLPTARRLTVGELLVPLGKVLDQVFGVPPTGPTQWFEVTDPKEQDRLWPWIYLNRKAIAAQDLPFDQVAEYVRDWLSGRDDVEIAFTRGQLESTKFPMGSFGAKAVLTYRSDRCGDVLVVPKPGVLVTGYSGGTSHGSAQDYDVHIPVLIMGGGVPKRGEQAAPVSSLIVAPLLSWALGIEPPPQAVERLPADWNR